jgi:hypothetical protein
MFKSQKHVFWNALLLAVFIFASGIALGFWFEGLRNAEINELFIKSDIDLLDARIVSELLSDEVACESAVQENIDFGNRIYREAQILNRYETAERISERVKIQHYKYDLLRTLFWINSINIKKKCDADFHTVVYLYDYIDAEIETKAKQAVFSNVLGELKKKRGDEIMLIPIAGDTEFSSIDVLKKTYHVEELPVILIDEKKQITEISSVEQIEEIIGNLE